MNRKAFLQLITMSSLAWLIPPQMRAKVIAESWPNFSNMKSWKPPRAIYPLQSKDALKFHQLKVDYLKMLDEFGREIGEYEQSHLDFLQFSIDFWEFNHVQYGPIKGESVPIG